jgi:hypothetical protein
MRAPIVWIAVIIVVSFSLISLSSNSYSLIDEKGDFSSSAFWLSHTRNSDQSVVWENGGIILTVNDTEGAWSWAKVQRGRLPHGWTCFDSVREIEFRSGIVASANTVFLRLRLKKVGSFLYFNESFSSVNMLVGLFFQLNDFYDLPINQSCQLNVDFPIIWTTYQNGAVVAVSKDVAFEGYVYDEDKHYQVFSGIFVYESDKWIDVQIDIGAGVERALKYYKLGGAVLRNVDVLLEGYYGSGSVQVDYVELEFKPQINSGYVLSQTAIFGVVTWVLGRLLKRRKGSVQKPS